MIKFFENKRKKKFLNRLKYGQDKKPVYNQDALIKALSVGDEDKAKKIFHEIMKRKLKGVQ